MKKFLVLLMVIPLVFACSSDDKEGLSLSEDSVELYSGDTYQIDAMSGGNISYVSEDEFVGSVSATGLITANKVGETRIGVSDASSNAIFNLTTIPKYSTYPEPILDFGMSRSDLIKKLGQPDVSTDTGIAYTSTSNKYSAVMYGFENGKLSMVSVMVNISYHSELSSFLLERYTVVDVDGGSYIAAFINSNKINNYSMLIALNMYNTKLLSVLYMPSKQNKNNKSVNANIESMRLNELANRLLAE